MLLSPLEASQGSLQVALNLRSLRLESVLVGRGALRTQVSTGFYKVTVCQGIFTNSSYNPDIFHLFALWLFHGEAAVMTFKHSSCLVF